MNPTERYLHISRLTAKLLKGEISPEEKSTLDEWVNEDNANRRLFENLTSSAYLERGLQKRNSYDSEAAWSSIDHKLEGGFGEKRSRFNLLKYAAALIPILIAGGLGIYYKMEEPQGKKNYVVNNKSRPESAITPGSKQAVLVLSDGKRVTLGSNQLAELSESDGTFLQPTESSLIYKQGTSRIGDNLNYNSLIVPRGGEYKLILADGTKVWINSESSVRYPTVFAGREREVYLTGEAYFEVAKNPSKPFIVKTDKGDVKVLGTHFNVNSYPDAKSFKATLIEGSVQVNANADGKILKPGQQAVINHSGHLSVLEDVNTDQVVAWKNGLIQFHKASLVEIMQQVERWYDIKVIFPNHSSSLKFTGKMSRNVNLDNLIEIFKFQGVKFRIEGKTITVIN